MHYYPLTRQSTQTDMEINGRRMLLVAVLGVVVVIAVLGLGSTGGI